jgi:signal transduction histidine kinase/CheY-like chemotaxis protein
VRVIPELNTDYAMGATFAAADAADRLRHHLGEMAREGLLDEIFQAYYPLSHYRSPETFAETETERTRRLLRWGALGLAALCAALWMGLQRSRRNAHAALAMAEMRSQFLASISHELRTPLNGVLGLASALDATSLDRTQREYVSLIRSSGEILLRTVNEVLDFSRLEAGKQVAAQEPVALQRLVESVVSVLAPVAQQKGLELQWAVDRDLPRTVLSDETALRQILMNLVGNAIKFTAQGCVALQVRLENMEHTSALLRIAVSDSGPGIPAGQEESVFDPFVRGTDLRTQAIVGTGLGLSITKRLVLLMGGSIQVRNNSVRNSAEAGCTFEVLLPLAETDAEPVIQPPCPLERTLPGHVLLAARQPLALEMLSQQLRAAGAHLGEVSEEEALRAALDSEKHWDLIVLDDSLTPNLFALAADLRSHPAAATALIVCMTREDVSKPATSASASPDLALSPGIGCYRKPYLPELFCSFVENLQNSFWAHAGRNLAAAVGAPQPGAAPERESPRETKERLASGQFAVSSAQAPGAAEATAAWKPAPQSCPKDREECALCIRQRAGGVVDCLAEFAPAGLSPLALVVDDNPVNRKVMVSLLRNLGVGCDTAASGEEALRFFAAQSYSWVLMDWHMPGMDGLDAIQRMRERESIEERRRTPVVLCTASSGNDPGLSKGKELLDAVLPKPITLHSLCHALRASAGRCPSPAAPPSRVQPEPTASFPVS